MKIYLNHIKVRDIVENYVNNDEEGVFGYNGKLNIRPKYQREFVYDVKHRDAVINSINKDFPLNVMYWCRNEDDTFEVLDGQQRTISICEYINGTFSINNLYFHNLTDTEKNKILDYELMIYICEGNDKEKLDWFRIINIAGVQLTEQELRNAIYTGEWLSDAKHYFSKNNCLAYKIANTYMKGHAIRQNYLETALDWISEGNIEQYMAEHQHKSNAIELWNYFQSVISWVKNLFPKYRTEMKGLDWGLFYNQYKDNDYNAKELEEYVSTLMADEYDEITSKKGIYEYVLSGNERCLSIRAFKDGEKRKVYERQKGICPKCKKHFEINEMEADHITPWSKGGHTTIDNCQMLCKNCNRYKSDK
ncbi:MAG: DUF262 domain-containing protein [Alphaproteobacteria bacterium]|nr:DUF262 domain-containing protein [Alphaproteobacteria bacterium]